MSYSLKWQQQWQQSQNSPYAHCALVLLALNGLSVEHIVSLQASQIDLEHDWLTTSDHAGYPLTTFARDALQKLPAAPTPASPILGDHLTGDDITVLQRLEVEAHRRLAGAIWYTSADGRLLLETSGTTQAPILPLRFTFPFSVVNRLHVDDVSEIALHSREVLQAAADWLFAESFTAKPTLTERITGMLKQGNFIFVIASTGVSGMNLIHNVIMGRLLSPSDYGQLTFVITLQLLVGLLPSALQTVSARFSARYHARGSHDLFFMLRRTLAQYGMWLGFGGAILLLVSSPLLVSLFQLKDVALLLPIVIVVPFFVRMGIDRGLLQGLNSYWSLSAAYLIEGLVRLVVSVILVIVLTNANRGLEGGVWALAQSIGASWVVSWVAMRHVRLVPSTETNIAAETRAEWRKLASLVLITLVGQALITNSDFILVKNFFSPDEAGLYAAVSVLGRIVYFGALPLTVLLVPMIARRQALNEPTQPIFRLLMTGGVLVCGMLIAGAFLFAPTILGLMYGEVYVAASGLLAPYALAASLYTLSNLVITYQIALGKGGETWMPLLAGAGQIVGVMVLHESLLQVIAVQVVLMVLLLGMVLWRVLRGQSAPVRAEPVAAGA